MQKALSISVIKTNQLMLYREIIAVCPEIHKEHNAEFFNVKPGGA